MKINLTTLSALLIVLAAACNLKDIEKPKPLIRPKAGFSFTISDGKSYPYKVTFTNTSENAAKFSWDFDNGDTSSQQNPSDSFFVSKTYNVKLVVQNNIGSDSITQQVLVEIPKPAAGFDFTVINDGEFPCNVIFTNTSQRGAVYKWYFGNGDTSNKYDLQYGYKKAGKYAVKLVATNPSGSDSVTKTVTINAGQYSVSVYLITPKDTKFNQQYFDAVKNCALSLQGWYKTQMGNNKTFTVSSLVVVDALTGLHDSVWYNSNNGSFSGSDPRYYGFYNTYYEMQQLLGSNFNTTKYTYFVYVAAPGGGAGAGGFCALGDQDLKGLLGINTENTNPDRWIGGGHELGHALGLPHPDNQNPQALMWTGYTIYPNCILQQQDKDILNASSFFK